MTDGIGGAERRLEDERFLTGRGRYLDDLALPRQVWGSVVRSPHAHAELGAIDTGAAAAMSGVLAVYTAADLADASIGGIPCMMKPKGADGSESATTPRPVLAAERVRMVGDPVAFVVAESAAEARAAAEAVSVDYRPLPAVTDAEAALRADAPALHTEAPGNLCLDWELGDRAAVEEALAAAAHRVSLESRNQRVSVCPMETRSALGAYDAGSGVYTLTAGTQGVHLVRNVLAKHVLKVPAQRVRVVTPDVGGAFGVKLWVYPEYALVLFAARRLGRPVKWVADRGEAMASDHQGRDLRSRATLALDADGYFLAVAIESVANLGAYASNYGPSVATVGGTRALIGPYRTPALHVRVRAAYTNTAPTDAYRGAGRPENVYLLERLIDKAAHELGLDPAALRRRNMVAADAMPYRTPLGHTYDSGDFPAILEKACDASGWRAARSREAGAGEGAYLRGIGIGLLRRSLRRQPQPVGGAALRRRRRGDAADRQPVDGTGARDGLRPDRRRSPRHSPGPRARAARRHRPHRPRQRLQRLAQLRLRRQRGAARGGGSGGARARRRRRAAGGAGGGRALRGRALPHRRHGPRRGLCGGGARLVRPGAPT